MYVGFCYFKNACACHSQYRHGIMDDLLSDMHMLWSFKENKKNDDSDDSMPLCTPLEKPSPAFPVHLLSLFLFFLKPRAIWLGHWTETGGK